MPATITSHVFADGDLDYVGNLNAVRTDIASIVAELLAARNGSFDLDARLDLIQGEIDALEAIAITTATGFTANISANNFKLTSLANATNPQDATNLQTVQALVTGGGTPSNIPITSLGLGTLLADEAVVREGSNLVGRKGLLKPVNVNATGSCVANTREIVALAGNITRTLPPSPLFGDVVGFADALSNFGTFTLTIDPGGSKKIEDTVLGETMTVTSVYESFGLLYIGNDTWKVIKI